MADDFDGTPVPTKRFWLTATLLVAVIPVALALSSLYVFVLEPRLRPPPAPDPSPEPHEMSTPFFWPGIQEPRTQPAAEAKVPDDEQVIGISSAGKHRAYLVSAFGGTYRHVVNDRLGDVPITITYCDRTQCTTVFTSDNRGAPLHLALGGFEKGRMLLRINGGYYYQDSAKPIADGFEDFPYPTHPFTKTTWKLWRQAHPDTDIYVGVSADERSGQENARAVSVNRSQKPE